MSQPHNHTTTKIGLLLSIACAIHCMAMPILLISFPFLSETFLHDPILEWSLLSGMVLIGLFTMDHYRKKHHASLLPTGLFLIGAVLCLIAMLIHSSVHLYMIIAGTLLITLSHAMNIRYGRMYNETDLA